MYQALYRKYRPAVFGDVIGQEPVTKTLKNQIKNAESADAAGKAEHEDRIYGHP